MPLISDFPADRLVLIKDGDGWEALYDNGIKVDEGHHVDVLAYLNITLNIQYATNIYSEEVLSLTGSFPDNISEVEVDK